MTLNTSSRDSKYSALKDTWFQRLFSWSAIQMFGERSIIKNILGIALKASFLEWRNSKMRTSIITTLWCIHFIKGFGSKRLLSIDRELTTFDTKNIINIEYWSFENIDESNKKFKSWLIRRNCFRAFWNKRLNYR